MKQYIISYFHDKEKRIIIDIVDNNLNDTKETIVANYIIDNGLIYVVTYMEIKELEITLQ